MSKPTSSTDLPPPSSAAPPGNSLATAQPTDPAAVSLARAEQWESAKWNIALAGAIICPLIIALPPRKLDLYTCLLMTGGTLSAYHLAQARWGVQPHMLTPQQPMGMSTQLPTQRAQELHMEMLRRGERKETWKEQRLREDAEKFARGESYGSVIGDYVREAFGMAKRDEEGRIVQVKPEDEGKS